MMNKKQLELYVHIPFCVSKCSYCDFLSFPANQAAQEEYVSQLIGEIRYRSAKCQEYQVVTIFIGGGTPSILEGELMERLISALRSHYSIHPWAELTIEANPGTLNPEKLKRYRALGINRISIGLQSANNRELKNLGRIHTYETFLKSYEMVRTAGFTDINIDLMSALPGQTVQSWRNTLKKVTMLRPEHISAYSLIIEEGTPFYERYGQDGLLGTAGSPLPDEESEREMYYVTKDYLRSHGYERYEISNYAKPGNECRHNIGYWTGVEYLGFGLGASSYIKGMRFHNTADMKEYLACGIEGMIGSEKLAEVLYQEKEVLTLAEKMEEFMFLGLRLTQGVSELEFAAKVGHSIWDIYGDVIERYTKQGLLEVRKPYIRLTELGVDLSNQVLGGFLF